MAVTHLADTSALGRMAKPSVAQVLEPMIMDSAAAVCAAVQFELRFSARDLDDYRSLTDEVTGMPTIPLSERVFRRALDVQTELAQRGAHRALSLVDLLVAAAAESRNLVVLHYDADFELVASITGQPAQWIVPRVTAMTPAHGRSEARSRSSATTSAIRAEVSTRLIACGAVAGRQGSGALFVQTVIVPLLAIDLRGLRPDFRATILVIIVLGIVTTQVTMVCVWRLLTMARRGTVSSHAAFRYVDIVIGAVATASLLTFGLATTLARLNRSIRDDAGTLGLILLIFGAADDRRPLAHRPAAPDELTPPAVPARAKKSVRCTKCAMGIRECAEGARPAPRSSKLGQ